MSTDAGQAPEPEELREFIADVLDLDVEAITDDAHFTADLDVDSLKTLEVLVALERKYKIDISEDEVRKMTCFAQVRDLVTEKLAA